MPDMPIETPPPTCRSDGEGTDVGPGDAELLSRFVSQRDEAAFAALVARHGPMVLAVCRHVLRNAHEAEDAFQATFLVLARKARSLRVGDMLGGWLHRVGLRIAVEANRRAVRRRAVERHGLESDAMRANRDGESPSVELLAALHEEIDRLPEKYRLPVVLCDLEARTRDEAARALGWPPGTVAGRLARARNRLRDRLTRRGWIVTGGLLGILAAPGAVSAAVPTAWIETTVAAATAFAGRDVPTAGTTSAGAVSLAEGVIRTMRRTSLIRSAGGLTMMGLILTVLAATLAPAQPVPTEVSTIWGTVIDAEGRPAEGVRVFLSIDPNDAWGRVAAEGKTDANGRFRLNVPGPPQGFLWAYRPGAVVASRNIYWHTFATGQDVKLAIGPPARTDFEVRGPDGKPVAGATIEPRVLSRKMSVPRGLAELIAAETVTDARGRAVLTAFWPEEVETAYVSAQRFGRQYVSFGHIDLTMDTKVVTLLPAGRLVGRLVGEAGAVGHRKLTLLTYNKEQPSIRALAYPTTDATGRFEIPEIAVGLLNIGAESDITASWYPVPEKAGPVEAGRTTEVVLIRKNAIPIRGVVRDRETKRPIAGARLTLGFRGVITITTAEDGRFEGYAQPGWNRLILWGTPEGYIPPNGGDSEVTIPEDATAFEVPPIELVRSGIVRGIVVDGQDKPVSGAEVNAVWTVDVPPERDGLRQFKVRSDPEGRFIVDRVGAGLKVRLTASRFGLTTPQFVWTKAGDETIVRLRIDDSRAESLQGRVLGPDGRPVVGAQVRLRVKPPGGGSEDDPVDFDGPSVLFTDAEGRFRTPRQLDRESRYAAFVSAEGLHSDRTPWTQGGVGRFSDLRLSPRSEAATTEGRILDRQGRPIADVEVWSSEVRSVRARTNAEGRFRLADLPGRTGFLFARKDGFRFRGRAVDLSRGPFEIVLTRTHEEPESALKSLPPPLARPEALALARKVLEPHLYRVMKSGDKEARSSFLTGLAAANPDRVLEILETKPLADAPTFYEDYLRAEVARRLMNDQPEKAEQVIRTIKDPSNRVSAYLDMADTRPADDRAGKLRLVERALLDAREVPDPAYRVACLAQTAGRLLGLGETERGTALLRGQLPTAQRLSDENWSVYARGVLAEELARIDLKPALELIRDVHPKETSLPERHLINIAQELGPRDPAEAERIIRELSPSDALSMAAPRLCHALARKDLERARGLLDLAENRRNPFARPYALGMMARAVADTDRPEAERLLREAFEELERLSPEERTSPQYQSAAIIGAALLPVAERIDSKLVTEFLWRSLSFRDGNRSSESSARSASNDAILALLLARYDRDPARVLYDPLADRLETLMTGNADVRALVWAGATIDPAGIAAQLEALPVDAGPKISTRPNSKLGEILSLVSWLTSDESKRWDRVVSNVLWLQLVDQKH